MKAEVEWDGVVNIACAAYSIFPNSQSHESVFFPLFRRDVCIPTLAILLQPNYDI